MEILFERCAGLDVHKMTVVACVRASGPKGGSRTGDTRTFATTTRGLLELSQWLQEFGVTHVAMESTGVYWRPVHAILEGSFELLLVNARHVKMVPGRKTDVRDCEWLAQLMECGLLRGSFIATRPMRDLRDLTRYRKSLIQDRAQHVNRVAKTLELAGIKLGGVVTDLMGKTGRKILQALIDGVDDPEQLAALAEGLLRKKQAALQEAVVGRMTPHYAFLLAQQLAVIDQLQGHVDELDTRIEAEMLPFADACTRARTIPGVAVRGSQAIIAEIGADMSRFPTARHLASWAGVCPGNNERAGKRLSGRTNKGNNWLRTTLNECAWSAVRTRSSYYRALYHRIKTRRGARRAIVAVEHAMLVALWHMLSNGVDHEDLGSDYFDRANKQRIQRHHVRRLEQLGFEVALTQAA